MSSKANQRIVEIYRSRKHAEMYLYVEKKEGLSRVPEALMERFGQAEASMTLLLTPEKKLARASAEKVLAQIETEGFYLQLPPAKDPEMMEIQLKNTKLSI